jgi:hypothetical protein
MSHSLAATSLACGVAHLSQRLVPEQRVVIHPDLAIQCNQTAGCGHDQRVDFNHRKIACHEQAVQVLGQFAEFSNLCAGQIQAESQCATLKILQPQNRIAIFLEDFFRRIFCNFFDFHAAFAGGDQCDALGFAIHGQAEVKFARNRQRFFDQQARHQLSIRRILVSHQRFAEQRIRRFMASCSRSDQLHPAGLAASTCMDLRLDHPGCAAQLRHCCVHLGYAVYRHTARRGNSIFAQHLFSLIFMQVHKDS